MYRTVAARYIGPGSLHPMKTSVTFYKQLFGVLQNVKEEVEDDLPQALHLDKAQVAAINKDNLLLKGMYGSGKTIVVEHKVLEILKYDPNAHVYLVVWEGGKDLVNRFKVLKDDGNYPNLKVMNGKDICR